MLDIIKILNDKFIGKVSIEFDELMSLVIEHGNKKVTLFQDGKCEYHIYKSWNKGYSFSTYSVTNAAHEFMELYDLLQYGA